MKTRNLLIPLLLAIAGRAHAQDPHFSQFYASPLSLNPALTGKFNGTLRVAGNYRNQWPDVNNAYITSTVSVDGNILRKELPENDAWGLGLMAMTDKTASGILNSNFIAVSTAYHKALDYEGNNQLGVGFQATYTNETLYGNKLKFSDGLQMNGTWLVSPTEQVNQRTVSANFFDVNAGMLYNGTFTGRDNIYFGVSLYHLNKPKFSFLDNDQVSLPSRLTLHGGGYFPTSFGSTLYLSALYSTQNVARETVAGGALQIPVDNDEKSPTNFYIGAWTRFSNVTDAVIPYVGLDFGNFNLGMTYDVNISSFKPASQGHGGIEISLIYTLQKSDGNPNWNIPCPRF